MNSTTLVSSAAERDARGDDLGRGLAEEALRASEERYRMLLDGIQDHAIFMLDPQGRVVSWNTGAERIKGYKAEEIIGRYGSCFFTPEDIELSKPQEWLRITAARGRHEERTIRVRKDGSRFPAHVTFTALHDPSGTLRGFAEISHDLSQSEASEARYRGLLEAAPDAMVVVNRLGQIVLLNVQAEKQFGYPRNELVGQAVKNIIPEGFAERLVADGTRSAAEALAQQIGTGIELAGRRRDGSSFPIEIMLSPLESPEGILVTAAIRDISLRKQADEALSGQTKELASANKELEAFSYSVSHDLRSPLRSIDGFSQILLEDYGDKLDAGGRDSLHRVRAASQRMGILIDDMLALSQVTRREIRAERTDLSALATAIEAELRESGPQRQVDFVIAPGLVADTDPHLIRIALWNLLGNAWKFTGRREKARIEFGITDAKTYFVKDDGAGFDMAYADKLFGAFQRMHGVTEFEGTGIGLATVHRIIHRLGGRVWAEAVPDGGATFYFTLSERSRP